MEKQLIIIAEQKAKEIIALAEEKARKILEHASLMGDEKIKDYLFQAVQSGKAENSGLVDEMFKRIDARIGEAVEKHVNGKIRGLTLKLDNYIASDDSWKEEVKPSIDVMKSIQVTTSVSIWVLKAIIVIGGAFGIIYSFFKWIK